jgi:hypothetical protein
MSSNDGHRKSRNSITILDAHLHAKISPFFVRRLTKKVLFLQNPVTQRHWLSSQDVLGPPPFAGSIAP